MKKYLSLILFCFCFKAQAQKIESFTEIAVDTGFHVNKILDVYDDKMFPTIFLSIAETYSAKGAIIFEFDPKLKEIIVPGDMRCRLELKIITYKSPSDSTVSIDTMVVFASTTSDPYKNKCVLYYDSCHRIQVEIGKISYFVNNVAVVSVPAVFRLRSEIVISRNYSFLCKPSITLGDDSKPDYDYYDVNWSQVPGATEYDLEWTFFDSYSTYDGNSVCSQTLTNPDSAFHYNATRISTDKLSYTLTNAYPDGCILYRVRGVKVLPNYQRINSEWSSYGSISTSNFEQKLNRQMSITFAESGMKKEVFDYFDGSTRNRQSITRDNTSDSSIVGETIYDFHGRPAVNILPVPAFDGTIKYHRRFNVDASDTSYSWLNFDTGDCSINPVEMKKVSGAERYYSDNNPDVGTAPHKFLPQSEGFPYSVTEYTKDQTGRLRRQSGVGKDLMFGTNHETKYYYGKPGQVELDRMFGNDVGDQSHYTEELVIDPNGQASVTYKNLLNDKVIATSLVGESPASLQQLQDFKGDTIITTELLEHSDNSPMVIQSSFPYLAKSQGPYLFKYTLIPSSFELEDCDTNIICYDCLYDIDIQITSDCDNTPLFLRKYHNYQIPIVFDSTCVDSNVAILDSVELNLTVGTYHATRTVSVSKDAIDYYTERYLFHNTCLSFSDFFQREFDFLAATAGCYLNCDSCLVQLGDSTDFMHDFLQQIVDESLTPDAEDTTHARQAYDISFKECMLLCHPGDECEVRYETMLMDITPGGQYFRYAYDNQNLVIPGDAASIIDLGIPNNYTTIPYTDSNGQPITVSKNGVPVSPALLTPTEFFNAFNDTWKPSLVQLHPEICYYDFCVLNSSSTEYDFDMLNTDSYDSALAKGFLDPMSHDPFFTSGSGVSYSTQLTNKLNDYHLLQNTTCTPPDFYITMWQCAMMVALRESIPDLCNISVPNASGICPGDQNSYWRAFRSMYLSEKQTIYFTKQAEYANSCNKGFTCHNCIGSALPSYHQLGFSNPSSCNPCSPDYFGKTPRFVNSPSGHNNGFGNMAAAQNWASTTLDTLTTNICAGYRDYWKLQLYKFCDFIDEDTVTMILDAFQLICEEGSDVDHPMGSSTVPSTSTSTPATFQDVLQLYLPNRDPHDPFCNSLCFELPRPYDEPATLVTNLTYPEPPACVCSKLDSLYALFFIATGESSIDSFAVFLDSAYGSTLDTGQINDIRLMCHNNGCHTLAQPIQLPGVLSCEPCLSCTDVSTAFTDFCVFYQNGINTPGFTGLFQDYCNHEFGYSLRYDQYITFLDSCNFLDKDTIEIVDCDSLYTLYNLFLVDTPLAPLDQWFNNYLGLNYNINIYQHWLASCNLDISTMNTSTFRRSNPNSGSQLEQNSILKNKNQRGINQKHSYNNEKIILPGNVNTVGITYSLNEIHLKYSSIHSGMMPFTPCTIFQQAVDDYVIISSGEQPPLTIWLNHYTGQIHSWSYYVSQLAACGITIPSHTTTCGNLSSYLFDCTPGGSYADIINCMNTEIGINFTLEEYLAWYDSCTTSFVDCSNLAVAIGEYNGLLSGFQPPLTVFLNRFFDSNLNYAQWQHLIGNCSLTASTNYNSCDSIEAFYLKYGFESSGDITYQLNATFDLDFVWQDYADWLDSCNISYIDCENLNQAMTAYWQINLSVRPPVFVWLNHFLNLNFTGNDYQVWFERCELYVDNQDGECDSISDILQLCQSNPPSQIASCLNSYLNLNLTLSEYIQWLGHCGLSVFNCNYLDSIYSEYLLLYPLPPLTNYLNTSLNINLTFNEYLILFQNCSFTPTSNSDKDCDDLENAYNTCLADHSEPYLVLLCLNALTGYNAPMSFYINWLDSCGIDHGSFNCESLISATGTYNCPDTISLVNWLNYYFQANNTQAYYEAYFDTCEIDFPCCNIFINAMNEFDCGSYTQLYLFFNDYFNVNYTPLFWNYWIMHCNISIECDECKRITFLLEDYTCQDTLSLYTYLFQGTGWPYSNHQWDSLINACGYPIPCQIECGQLIDIANSWDHTDSLHVYLNYSFLCNYSDSTWLALLDSCHFQPYDCNELIEAVNNFHCEDNIPFAEFMNDYFGYIMTLDDWKYFLKECSIVPVCDSCTYLQILINDYNCNGPQTLADYLNENTHWGLSDTAYTALLINCGILWKSCVPNCSDLSNLHNTWALSPTMPFWAWLNIDLSLNYTQYQWSIILDDCDPCNLLTTTISTFDCDGSYSWAGWATIIFGSTVSDPYLISLISNCGQFNNWMTHCQLTCDSLKKYIHNRTCNSIPVWTYLNNLYGYNFTQYEWHFIIATCGLDTLCRCQYLTNLAGSFPCNYASGLTSWLNNQSLFGWTATQWLDSLSKCNAQTTWIQHCFICDTLQKVVHKRPCNSGSIYTYLNNYYTFHLTNQEWDTVFARCPIDTLCRCSYLSNRISIFPCNYSSGLTSWLNGQSGFGWTTTQWLDSLRRCNLQTTWVQHCFVSCDTLKNIIHKRPCNTGTSVYSWLNNYYGYHLTTQEWDTVFAVCPIDTLCLCDYLTQVIDSVHCNYTTGLVAWLNNKTSFGWTATQWLDTLFDCSLQSTWIQTCFDCVDLQFIVHVRPCNTGISVYSWLNNFFAYHLTNQEWDTVFSFCPIDTLCNCDYITQLIDTFPCNSSSGFTAWLSNQSGFGWTTTQWLDTIQHCNLDTSWFQHCFTCDSLQNIVHLRPCNTGMSVYSWLNNYYGYNLTIEEWDTVFSICPIDTLCQCDFLSDLMLGYPCPPGNVTLASWFNDTTGLNYTEQQVLQMLITCGIGIDPCDTINCITLDAAMHFYLAQQTPGPLVAYLNPIFGTHTLAFYQWALAFCHDNPGPLLCNEPMFPSIAIDPDSADGCWDGVYQFAFANAGTMWKDYQDSLRGTFRAAYEDYCMRSAQELFTVKGPSSEYHYTLYYYDQADNLVRTVPPNGVALLNIASVDSVKYFRKHPSATPAYNLHTMSTKYYYNTLNNVRYQQTPDAHLTQFWYDKVGRIAISRNAKQDLDDKYSYTLYDPLGRITEVGQINNTTAMSDAIARDPALLDTWFADPSVQRTQVTHTFYDYPRYTFINFTQDNLRNRVSGIIYQDIYDSDTTKYQSASHYSYDITGNVHTLLQENRSLESIGRNLKRIDYDYDLVSSKVNTVYYQKDSVDQFIHKYEYDANLRITDVLTSRDNFTWDRDATYEYYKHGPLARVEIGQYQVQGTDYAYTLQGWIKAINSSLSSDAFDMGQDGPSASIHKFIGRDALSLSLGYFENDFKPIGSSNPELTGFETFGNNLYNGNIRQSVYDWGNRTTDIQSLGYQYLYDQLNRLVHQYAYDKMDTINNICYQTSPLTDLEENYDYDPNGNILHLSRNGYTINGSQLGMDEMTYNYDPGTNKLLSVDDAINDLNYPDDIDDQSANNYDYDEIGNLISDQKEQLDVIDWNNYGKIDSIYSSGKMMAMKFRYDPAGNRIEKIFYNLDVSNHILRTRATHYVRDASGNQMAVYEFSDHDTLMLKEFDIYGSSRVGIVHESDTIVGTGIVNDTVTDAWQLKLGDKEYEQTNHLGNVMSTITDKPVGIDTDADNVANYYDPEYVTAQDYYPFGMLQPERHVEGGDSCYRFGFNGKEKDNEVKGQGNQYDYGFRIYNPRIGRFLSIDPLFRSYPWYTPFQFAGNGPIWAIDMDGLEDLVITTRYTRNTQMLNNYETSTTESNWTYGTKPMTRVVHIHEVFNEAGDFVRNTEALKIDIPTNVEKLTKIEATIEVPSNVGELALRKGPDKFARSKKTSTAKSGIKTTTIPVSGTFDAHDLVKGADIVMTTRFEGGEFAFEKITNPNVTNSELKQIAKALNDDISMKINIEGNYENGGANTIMHDIAGDDKSSHPGLTCKQLAQKRADTIRNKLISDYKISPDRVRATVGGEFEKSTRVKVE